MRAPDGVVLRDPDLHAHLMGTEVRDTVLKLRQWVFEEVLVEASHASLWLLRHAEEDPASPGYEETLGHLYSTCPDNLAERLHEALGVYRSVGRTALPPLLPLAHRLLQAEMHLYTSLKSNKPYREHLAHQTRVAALAHLWLSDGIGDEPGLPIPDRLRWPSLCRRWSHSVEFHLLRQHATRLGLEFSDPAEAVDEWAPVICAAALLAGLTHDVGYVQKALGEVSEPVAHTFDMLMFPPQSRVDAGVDELPLGRMYRRIVSEIEHGQQHAPLKAFLGRHYRELHSVVGALWLATLGPRLRRDAGLEEKPPPGAWRAEICFQLAAMMAFAHDLGLSDKARREVLGLREAGKNRDALNFRDFPLCTLFTLCDVLQEFGRPLRVVDGDRVGFVVPVAGIRLGKSFPDSSGLGPPANEEEREAREVLFQLWGLGEVPRENDGRLRVSLCTRDEKGELIEPAQYRLRTLGSWQEFRVGDKVSDWLKRAGLGKRVALTGDPSLSQRLVCRGRHLIKLYRRISSPDSKRRLGVLLQALEDLLGVEPENSSGKSRFRRLEEVLCRLEDPECCRREKGEGPCPEILRVAPLADLNTGSTIPKLAHRCLIGNG